MMSFFLVGKFQVSHVFNFRILNDVQKVKFTFLFFGLFELIAKDLLQISCDLMFFPSGVQLFALCYFKKYLPVRQNLLLYRPDTSNPPLLDYAQEQLCLSAVSTELCL